MRPIYKGYAMQNLRLGRGDKEAINILYGQSFKPAIDTGKKKRPIFEDIDICNTKWDAVMNCRDEGTLLNSLHFNTFVSLFECFSTFFYI